MERLAITRTGLPGIPEVPWGTHLCLFYQSGHDLIEILVPFAVAGIENHEACLLTACDEQVLRELEVRLRVAIPDFDRKRADGAIELFRPTDAYVLDGVFDPGRVTAYWRERGRVALERGFTGMRANGDQAWLRPDDWKSFQRFEETLGAAIAGERIMLLCAYTLDNRKAGEVFEVAHAHQIVLAMRDHRWETLEPAELGQTNKQLQAMRADLEWRVLQRTEELTAANDRLRREAAERMRVERALRESESRFRTAFQSSPLMTSIARLEDNGLIDVNQAFLRTFGYDRAEVIGRTSLDLGLWVDPAERERLWSIVRSTGSMLGYTVRMRTKAGRVLDLVGYTEVIELDGQRCALTASLDISARRRAEAALLEQQWLLNESERLTNTGSWQWNPEVDHVVWSRELYRIHEQDPELFRPSYESWIELVHPEDRLAVTTAIEAARAGQGSFSIEHRIVRPDGSIRVLHSVGYCRNDPAGHARLMGYASDITERREAEKSASIAARQLTALSRKLVDVQEAERRRLASDLHERVGQNLSAIGIDLDIISRELRSSSDVADRAKLLARLEDSVALLESSVDAVADVAAELRPPMLDDLGLMAALQWYARGFMKRTGVHVELRGDLEKGERLPPDHELAIFRIVQEALMNVAEHAHAQNIEIAFEGGPGACRLSVCDDGIGPQDRRTGRADQGLGLITMRERAIAIGGTFQFGARKEGGSCVTVTLEGGGA